MPTLSGTTVNGTQINAAIGQPTIGQMALWFPVPPIPALTYQKVGVLYLAQIDASRMIIVKEWDVTYPGIWPVFGVTQNTTGLYAIFRCWRPGLPYVFYWA